MSQNPESSTPEPQAGGVGGAGKGHRPHKPKRDPVASFKPKSLKGRTLPKWFLYACLGGALVLGFVLSSAISGEFNPTADDFNPALWFIFAAVLYVLGAYIITRGWVGKRRATDVLWRNLVFVAFVLALIPLVWVLYSVTSTGLQGLTNPGFFTDDMSQVSQSRERRIHEGELTMYGGVRHAIIGSLLITLTATLISVPIGLLTSIYLVEYARGGALARGITFFVDVMTGIPSIVAGLFGAAAVQVILGIGNTIGLWNIGPGDYRMGITASVALSVLMIPVVVRTTEEMLRVVPNELREASYALGVRKWRTIVKVVIPTAISGIAAGVTLAIARVIGETAPILLTAGMLTRANWNMIEGAMMTLPVYIYWTFTHPTGVAELEYLSHQRAWGAALVLIIIVMFLNLLGRVIATVFAPKKTGR